MKRIWSLLKDTFAEWKADDCPRLAAALAFYSVLSLAPILILAISLSSVIFDSANVRHEIIRQFETVIGKESAAAIASMIESAQRSGSGIIATIAGIAVLLWGASRVFAQLQTALNKVWGVEAQPESGIRNIIRIRLLSFSLVFAFGFLLLAFLVANSILSATGDIIAESIPAIAPFLPYIRAGTSVIVLTFLFAAIFKILPDVYIEWRDVWQGAFFTSILFTLSIFLTSLYLAHSSFASSYGAAGSIIVLLIWLSVSGQILFLGAEFTQVVAARTERDICPKPNAVKIIKTRVEKENTTSGGEGESQNS